LSDLLRSVYPGERKNIPEYYDLAHAVAFKFHDELAKIVADLESTNSLAVNVELTQSEIKEIQELEGEELWGWLESNGKHDVLFNMSYRQVTIALISDATHFIFESLSACAKGKTSVAFSLLRKPFKENLLMLEWLCGNPGDFIRKFNGESSAKYMADKFSPDDRKKIVSDALAVLDEDWFGIELVWNTRFDKSDPNNLETLWTKATHLVTSFKASATEAGNLNFIFSNESSVEDQWEYYYKVLPIFLLYFIQISEKVINRFVDWNEETRNIQLLMRNMAITRYGEFYQSIESLDDLRRNFQDLSFDCDSCKKRVSCSESDMDLFWLRSELRCTECGSQFNFWDIYKSDAGDSK